MATVFDVADYFLARQDENAGDTISNMKLQKLCYYAQGFTLALTGAALFTETIEAWEHGPVVPDLYRTFKSYGSSAIPCPARGLSEIEGLFSQELCGVLAEVNEVYGQFSAWKLRNFTHEEEPWLNHFKKCASSVIPCEELEKFFKTKLADEATA